VDCVCTKFGGGSSSRFPFRARTDRHTPSHRSSHPRIGCRSSAWYLHEYVDGKLGVLCASCHVPVPPCMHGERAEGGRKGGGHHLTYVMC